MASGNLIKPKGFIADVSIEADVLALFEYAISEMDGINVLINNAGIGGFAKLVDATTADFQKLWKINVRGLVMAGRATAQYFIIQDSGHIIKIGSTAAQLGFAQGSAYVTSKFAVSELTECWRTELRSPNVRVMRINPNEVLTDFSTKLGMPQQNKDGKLNLGQIAHKIEAMLGMANVGFTPDAAV
ncbi:SDR family oxidoreductase [Flavobacterium sp. JP2137]|uniref:SDR family oxidoreductase n=1 Tax=Flavobacterium sp. JP2137 TaxID=3414510 RepID=UPI003D2FD8AD